jgi:ADP-dependent NAD(P)H-hydrate dehydratase
MRIRSITDALLRRWPLPALDRALGKESRGMLLVVGGSDSVPGAASLAALAGIRVGTGTIQIATTRGAYPIVAGLVPEACVIALPTQRGEIAVSARPRIAKLADSADAVVLGPGSTTSALARGMRGDATWVVDAGAIKACTATTMSHVTAIITPHAGEMAELLGISPEKVRATAADIAVVTAKELSCVVVLKGDVTFIAAPDGAIFRSTAGNHGLGMSGSGDVLAGAIGGLAARGADAVQAAVWGVHLHGRAGDVLAKTIGPYGYRAVEVIEQLPRQRVAASRSARGW